MRSWSPRSTARQWPGITAASSTGISTLSQLPSVWCSVAGISTGEPYAVSDSRLVDARRERDVPPPVVGLALPVRLEPDASWPGDAAGLDRHPISTGRVLRVDAQPAGGSADSAASRQDYTPCFSTAGPTEANAAWVVAGCVTGPLYGLLGQRWRVHRSWISATLVTGALCLEPFARHAVGQLPPPGVVWDAEVVMGGAVAACFVDRHPGPPSWLPAAQCAGGLAAGILGVISP